MKTLSLIGICLFLFTGCSFKPPKPVKLDGKSAISINHSLILQKHKEVPKDYFLTTNNWTYNMYFEKNKDTLIANDKMVKAFFLAHNAGKIIIIGTEKIAKEYKKYFLQNQVTAEINIHVVDSINFKKNLVNVLFFSNEHKDKK